MITTEHLVDAMGQIAGGYDAAGNTQVAAGLRALAADGEMLPNLAALLRGMELAVPRAAVIYDDGAYLRAVVVTDHESGQLLYGLTPEGIGLDPSVTIIATVELDSDPVVVDVQRGEAMPITAFDLYP